ncbi:hypothetical protein HRbin01_00819 [archaeon HR01]|nr:hypothetical protein HRbin01_00819 [archaeon HR01]
MVSPALRLILEATVLAIYLTIVPVAVLVWFYFSGLFNPLYLIGWLGLALGWTALLTYLYMRRSRKRLASQAAR